MKAFFFFGDTSSDKTVKYKIAEAYLKLDIDYNSNDKGSIRQTLRSAAESEIREFKYEDGFVIIVQFKKGSLKAKVVIYGTIIMQGIIFYGEIRQGATQMYDDVKALSERIINNASNRNDDINENIIRTERRTGLIGRLKRTLDRIEHLQSGLSDLSQNEIQGELTGLEQDLSNIIAILDQQEQQALLNSLPNDIRSDLPQPNPTEMTHMEKLYALKPEDLELEDE